LLPNNWIRYKDLYWGKGGEWSIYALVIMKLVTPTHFYLSNRKKKKKEEDEGQVKSDLRAFPRSCGGQW